MITVNVRTTSERKSIMVESASTLMDVITEAGIDTAGKTFQLNGMTIQASELGKSFVDFGVSEGGTCMLSAVAKADSAC